MQNPLEITFKDIVQSARLENLIQEKFSKINKITNGITKCHVVMEKLSKHHKKGNPCCVLLDIKIAHFPDIVVREESKEGEGPVASAVREVFKKTHELIKKQIGRRQKRIARPDKEGMEGIETDLPESSGMAEPAAGYVSPD